VVGLDVGAALSGAGEFGVASYYVSSLLARVTLEAVSVGNDVFAHVATDNTNDGEPVFDSVFGYGVLDPGSYQLRAGSYSEGFGFEDALTGNWADYAIAFSVPEPSSRVMLCVGVATLGMAGRRRELRAAVNRARGGLWQGPRRSIGDLPS